MKGIYCYIDKKTNSIIYIGKDSYIEKNRRHRDHLNKAKYNQQQINSILQNNINRYEYRILEKGNISQKLLSALEMVFIQKYNPFFNFTNGGDGSLGYKHTISAREKVSKGQSRRNSTGFFRVSKKKTPSTCSGFSWLYTCRFNGKNVDLFSIDLNALEEKVKENGLEWKILDEELAKQSLEENKKYLKKKKKNSTGYFRVHKSRENSYSYRYQKNKKRMMIYAKSIEELKRKVKLKGFEWKKL